MTYHVLITGGTHGVGRATVELLLSKNMKVSTCARNSDEVKNLNDVLLTDNLFTLTADIRNPTETENFITSAFNRFGHITGIVNNAGEACVGQLSTTPIEILLDYFNVKVGSALRLIQLALPKMRSDGASIVNVAGAAGADPTALLGVAGVANAALRNLSRMLADELAERRVRVNTVNPGTLDTRLGQVVIDRFAEELGVAPELIRDEMYGSLPLGRVPTANDIASVIAFYLGNESSMITGGELTPDGGTLIRRLRG